MVTSGICAVREQQPQQQALEALLLEPMLQKALQIHRCAAGINANTFASELRKGVQLFSAEWERPGGDQSTPAGLESLLAQGHAAEGLPCQSATVQQASAQTFLASEL